MLVLCAPAVDAQVRMEGSGDPAADARIRALLAHGNPLVVTRDTLIERGSVVSAPVLVLGARLVLEGRIDGHLIGIDADLFLRPTAVVQGDLVAAAGGVYPSGFARVTGTRIERPLADYRVRYGPSGYVISARGTRRPVVQGDGFRGVLPPAYDRVDGLSLRFGASLHPRLRLGYVEPVIRAGVAFRGARGEVDGWAEAALVRGAGSIAIGAERLTVTNEAWIRGEHLNSLAYLVLAHDARDYHHAERIYVRGRHDVTIGSWALRPEVTAMRELAGSLRARDTWTLFAPDSLRPNPGVDDGRLDIIRLGMSGGWSSATASLTAAISAETGRAAAGGASYQAFVADLYWEMDALFGHRLRVEGHARGPVAGTETLPTRRWSFVGGPLTLPTFQAAEFRGDRLVFVRTEYGVPVPVDLPLLGTPEIWALHAAGKAWSAGADATLEQNVGVRLEAAVLYLRVTTDPGAARRRARLDVGIASPF